jgi:hypothetical protein
VGTPPTPSTWWSRPSRLRLLVQARAPIGQRSTARLFNTLMTDVLGYSSYLAQGGDWGAMVTSWLGRDHGTPRAAIHLNMLGFRPHGGPQGEAEIAWAQKSAAAMDVMGAYFRLQVSKPQSIAWMGAGNPVGQAAWIAERFHDWSDLSAKPWTRSIPKDRLLTNIMIYVMTGSFTTGAWYYRGLVEEGGLAFEPGQKLEVPTAFANFPGEPLYQAPPRSLRRARLQHRPLDRHAPRRPLRGDGGTRPVRRRGPRLGPRGLAPPAKSANKRRTSTRTLQHARHAGDRPPDRARRDRAARERIASTIVRTPLGAASESGRRASRHPA